LSGEFSERAQDEYDCKNVVYRTLYISLHEEKFAGGSVTFNTSTQGEWHPIPPDTVGMYIFKLFCKKFKK
jgi:hypothetical protein